MKVQYNLKIESPTCNASFKLIYVNGYFKSLEKVNGKLSDKQHKWLMNFAPQLEKAIQILELDKTLKEKGFTWEKIEKFQSESLFKTMLDEYYSWYKEKLKIVPKITGIETKALKTIITHLGRMASTEMEIIQVWNSIFQSWDNQTSFYQSQVELRQINQNLNTILRAIKEDGTKGKYDR